MISWFAVRDYLRLVLACAGYVLFDPAISEALNWAPSWVQGLFSVLISALVAFVVFAVFDPTTSLTVTWTDAVDKVAATGPGLDVSVRESDGLGRVYLVEVERTSRTWLARLLYRRWTTEGLELRLDWNQPELRLIVERSARASGDGKEVRFQLGAPNHRSSTSAADIGVGGTNLYADEVTATLRHSVRTTTGRWSRASGFLVRVRPSITSVRMIKAR